MKLFIGRMYRLANFDASGRYCLFDYDATYLHKQDAQGYHTFRIVSVRNGSMHAGDLAHRESKYIIAEICEPNDILKEML